MRQAAYALIVALLFPSTFAFAEPGIVEERDTIREPAMFETCAQADSVMHFSASLMAASDLYAPMMDTKEAREMWLALAREAETIGRIAARDRRILCSDG